MYEMFTRLTKPVACSFELWSQPRINHRCVTSSVCLSVCLTVCLSRSPRLPTPRERVCAVNNLHAVCSSSTEFKNDVNFLSSDSKTV